MEVYNVTANAETFTCNAYLVDGERTTLVDVGAWEGVVDTVRDHVDTVDRIVLTHQHPDHVAQLDAVCAAFDPDCYAYGESDHRSHAIEDGDFVDIGDESFDVVYTPGHAGDHVSFVSPSTLFSGDVVAHDDGAFDYGSFGRTDRPGQSRERLIQSIEDLLDRLPDGVEHLYAGHGDEFHGDVRDLVETALDRAQKRQPKYPDEQ